MRIPELKWLVDNKEKLNKEDYEALNSFDLFNQYENGEIDQNAVKMLELLSLAQYLYKKYAS